MKSNQLFVRELFFIVILILTSCSKSDDNDTASTKLNNEQIIENEKIINENILTPLENLNKKSIELLNSSEILDEQKNILNFGNDLFEKAKIEYEKLSPEEKQQMIDFLNKNNYSFIVNLEDVSSKTKFASNKIECCDFFQELGEDEKKLIKAKVALILGIGVTADALLVPELSFSKVIAVFGAVFSIYQLTEVIGTRQSIIDKITIPISITLDNLGLSSKQISLNSGNSKTNNLVFENGIGKEFSIISLGRKIQKNDSSNQIAAIASIVSEINETDDKWNELKFNIDDLINKVGSFFGVTQNKLSSTDGLPQEENLENIELNFNNLEITDLPSSINYSLENLNGQKIKITFNSEIQLPIDFNATLKFNDNNFTLNEVFSVTLGEEEQLDITGVWIMNDQGITCSDGNIWGDGIQIQFFSNGTLNWGPGTYPGTYQINGDELTLEFNNTNSNITLNCPSGNQITTTQITTNSYIGTYNGTEFNGTFTNSTDYTVEQTDCAEDNTCSGPMRLFRQ